MIISVKKGNYSHLRWTPCESVPQPWRTVWSVLKKTKNRVTIWSSKPTPGHISWQNRNSKQYKHLMFIAAKTWKQPLCLSTDEWIKKMWYIHTVVYSFQFSSLSRVRLFATSWITARQASLSITNSRSLLKLMPSWVSDAIQPSHPLSSSSPPAPNPSQHQGLFQWVNSSHEVAKVLEFQLQHQSF